MQFSWPKDLTNTRYLNELISLEYGGASPWIYGGAPSWLYGGPNKSVSPGESCDVKESIISTFGQGHVGSV